MFWLAWEFFLERICYQDSAAYMIEMFSKQKFAIVHGRYGALFSQVIPVTLLHLKAPLSAIMIGYSVNFVLLYFVCFWFCLSVCRHRSAAYAICILLVYSVNLTFFWPVTELFQGIIYCVVFFAWWNSPRPRLGIIHILVALGLCILALRTHPLTSLVLFLAIIYDFLDQSNKNIKARIFRLSFCIVPILFLLFFSNGSAYEQAQVPTLKAILNLLPELWSLPVISIMGNYFIGRFFILLVGLIILLFVLGWKRKWLKLGLVVSFHCLYGLLLCLTYPYGGTDLNFENLFFPLAFCQVLLLAKELLIPQFRLWIPQISLVILTLIFLVQIKDQSRVIQYKTDHYQAISNNLRSIPDRKLIFSSYNYPHDVAMMGWPSFAESLLFSGLKGPDKCFSLYIAQENDYDWIRSIEPAGDLLLKFPWNPISSQQKLPKDYFNLPDQPYHFVNSTNAVSGDSMLALLANSRLEWDQPQAEFPRGTKPYCKLRIFNGSSDPIPSTRMFATSVFIAYRFYLNGKLVDWNSPKWPLLMDIHRIGEQLVEVEIPEQKEYIEIQYGLVGHNGYHMYLTSPRYPIRIH